MQSFFEPMSDFYMSKHYPQRSVFSAVAKDNKKNYIAVYLFFGLLLLLFSALAAFSVYRSIGYYREGDMEQVSMGLVLIGACFILGLLCLTVIVCFVKRNRQGAEGWMKKSAKAGGCTVEELRKFEAQVMAADSYVLDMTGKLGIPLTGQKPGVLTRDYIYLADAKHIVMRRSEIVSACLVERAFYINKGNTVRSTPYLSVTLVNSSGIKVLAETSREAGEALLALLRAENPRIDTNNNAVMHEREHQRYCKGLSANPT